MLKPPEQIAKNHSTNTQHAFAAFGCHDFMTLFRCGWRPLLPVPIQRPWYPRVQGPNTVHELPPTGPSSRLCPDKSHTARIVAPQHAAQPHLVVDTASLEDVPLQFAPVDPVDLLCTELRDVKRVGGL